MRPFVDTNAVFVEGRGLDLRIKAPVHKELAALVESMGRQVHIAIERRHVGAREKFVESSLVWCNRAVLAAAVLEEVVQNMRHPVTV